MQPDFRDLRGIVNSPGPNNDANDILKAMPSLQRLAATNTKNSVAALKAGQPEIEFLRPYAPDLAAWVTHFATVPGYYDADGHYARVLPIFNAFSWDQTNNQLNPLAPGDRASIIRSQGNMFCPGGATQPAPDNSNPFLDDGKLKPSDCNPTTRPPGP